MEKKPTGEQTWENYQDFMRDELPAAFRDHGTKNQDAQIANRLTTMEASIEGIQTNQQTIQNGFHEFGSEVIKGFLTDTGLIGSASTQQTTPTTASNTGSNQGVMNGMGVIDTSNFSLSVLNSG